MPVGARGNDELFREVLEAAAEDVKTWALAKGFRVLQAQEDWVTDCLAGSPTKVRWVSGYATPKQEAATVARLQAAGCRVEVLPPATLFHLADLPYKLAQLPNDWRAFRREIAPRTLVRGPGETPPITMEPVLYPMASSVFEQSSPSDLSLRLLAGAVSPRQVFAALESRLLQDDTRPRTELTVENLYWRDYFRLMVYKHGLGFSRPEGVVGVAFPWDWREKAAERKALQARWAAGQTGWPMVDALVRQLLSTGFVSFRGRQVLASTWTRVLAWDWRDGAAFFEAQLSLHDPPTNLGNWAWAAGVLDDLRQFRFLHPIAQAEKHDPDGRFVRQWVPELAALPAGKIHRPWALSHAEQRRYGVVLDETYPLPWVDIDSALHANAVKFKEALQASGLPYRKSLSALFVNRHKNKRRGGTKRT